MNTVANPNHRGRRSRPAAVALVLLATTGVPGCLIDDRPADRGLPPSSAPTASVPDAGSPVRRESAAKTLNDADPAQAPAGGTLDVEPGKHDTPAQ